MTELLNCPFCGSSATAKMYSPDMLFKVECGGCAAEVRGFDQCEQDAIDAWNTRAAPGRCDAGSVELTEEMLETGAQALANDVWHPPQPLTSLSPLDSNKFRRQALLVLKAALVSPPSEAGRDKAGSIPEQETWWLVEREGTGLYAVGNGQYPDWSPDPWRAYRYDTARAADNARLRIAADSLRNGSIATEHVFINKMPRALSRPDQGTVAVSSGAPSDKQFNADRTDDMALSSAEGKTP